MFIEGSTDKVFRGWQLFLSGDRFHSEGGPPLLSHLLWRTLNWSEKEAWRPPPLASYATTRRHNLPFMSLHVPLHFLLTDGDPFIFEYLLEGCSWSKHPTVYNCARPIKYNQLQWTMVRCEKAYGDCSRGTLLTREENCHSINIQNYKRFY